MSAYIIECDQMEDGEQIWFPNLFEAEQTILPGGCCTLKPVPDDYTGPRWYSEIGRRSVTAATVLASIEAIPETAENYRARREAIRDAKALIEQEKNK